MYFLLYSLFYLLSLLPLRILYTVSDFGFFVIYTLIKYRRDVVADNLKFSFPEKTVEEREAIAKKFYKGLIDSMVETIKLFSISDKKLNKMFEIDFSLFNELAPYQRRIQVQSAHQMNWELGNVVFAKHAPIPWVGVYLKQNNKTIDRILVKVRSSTGGVMIPAQEFRAKFRHLPFDHFILTFVADQRPAVGESSYWLNFLNRPTPFFASLEKTAIRNDAILVFVNTVKLKRGLYRFEPQLITMNSSKMAPGEITLCYRDFLEKSIRQQPENYLWSHRRWKMDFNPLLKKRWIDHTPPLLK